MGNLKYGTNEPIYRHRKQTCGCQGRGSGAKEEWTGFGVSRCNLLYLERRNNKVLQYSTGNYSQSPGIDHDGKYIWLSPFAVQQKWAHCKINYRSSCHDSVEVNLTSIHEEAGSTPGLAKWIKGPALPRAVV